MDDLREFDVGPTQFISAHVWKSKWPSTVTDSVCAWNWVCAWVWVCVINAYLGGVATCTWIGPNIHSISNHAYVIHFSNKFFCCRPSLYAPRSAIQKNLLTYVIGKYSILQQQLNYKPKTLTTMNPPVHCSDKNTTISVGIYTFNVIKRIRTPRTARSVYKWRSTWYESWPESMSYVKQMSAPVLMHLTAILLHGCIQRKDRQVSPVQLVFKLRNPILR